MKRLIAFIFCLALLATGAQAQTPKRTVAPANKRTPLSLQAVERQVEAVRRTVVLKVTSEYGDTVQGRLVLMGFADGKMVLLATRDFSNDVDILASDDLNGVVLEGPFKAEGKIELKQVGSGNIKITIPVKLKGQAVNQAKEFDMLTDAQAISMVNALQAKDDKALENYRKELIDTGRK